MKKLTFHEGFMFKGPLQWVGIVVTGASIWFGYTETPWILLAGVIGITLATTRHGFMYEFDKKRYRPFFEILGLKFGKWYPGAQGYLCLTVSPKTVVAKKAHMKSKEEVWDIDLWVDLSNKINVLRSTKQKALTPLKALAEELGLDIYSITFSPDRKLDKSRLFSEN